MMKDPTAGPPHSAPFSIAYKQGLVVVIHFKSENAFNVFNHNDLTRHCLSESKLCPTGLRYDPCSTGSSCETVRETTRGRTCIPGCVCPPGLVTESVNSRECIEPEQCACLDKDNNYHPPDSILHKGCIKWYEPNHHYHH